MTRLVILPGTDGTGALLGEFVASLGTLDSLVISYPTDRILGYEELAGIIRPQLPTSESFFLLGESFGGPLAILLAVQSRLCAGVILCASFARYASPLRAFGPLTAIVPVKLVPSWVTSWFLLGQWTTPRLSAQLAGALAAVAPKVLRGRIRAALRVDVTPQLKAIDVPLLYLQASQDRVVSEFVGRKIVATMPHASLSLVTGPHFLLQAAPQACAAEVRRFVRC